MTNFHEGNQPTIQQGGSWLLDVSRKKEVQ